MKGHREVETKNDEEDNDEIPELKDYSDKDIEKPVHREILVPKHALSTQIKEEETEQQSDNIFYTKC